MNSGCLSDALIGRLLAGSATDAEQRSIESHLDQCVSCREKLDLAGRSGLPMNLKDLDKAVSASFHLRGAMESLKSHLSGTLAGKAAYEFDVHEELNRILEPASHPEDLGQLDHYRITSVVGRGAMGIVLKGHDTQLDRIVAIKVMRPALAANSESRDRFAREARSAAAVKHDNLVTIHAVSATHMSPYIVMEYVEGESLQHRLNTGKNIEFEMILRIAQDISAGLAAAHAKSLIHRDIKPANILLDSATGRARITDFGLARAVEDYGLTQTNVIAGTPEYMSPEQTRGEPLDARTDLFSLGLLICEMTTGTSPMRGRTVIDTIRRVCDQTLAPLSSLNPQIPDWFSQLVGRLLEKDPEQRIPSAQDFLNATYQRSAPSPRFGSSNLGRKLSRAIASGSAIVFVLLLAIAIGKGWFGTTDSSTQSRQGERAIEFSIADKSGSWKSLGEAIAASALGDIIEIGTDEPVLVEPINLKGRGLVLRAAAGFSPVIVAASGNTEPWLTTDSSVILEGIEIRWQTTGETEQYSRSAMQSQCAIRIDGGHAALRDCRIACQKKCSAIALNRGSLTLETCHLNTPDSPALYWSSRDESKIQVSDCVFESRTSVFIDHDADQSGSFTQQLVVESSSFVGDTFLMFVVYGNAASPRSVRLRNCLVDVGTVCHIARMRPFPRASIPPSNVQIERMLKGTVAWYDTGSVFETPIKYLICSVLSRPQSATVVEPKTLEAWNHCWKLDPDSSHEMNLVLQARDDPAQRPVWHPADDQTWPNPAVHPGAPRTASGR